MTQTKWWTYLSQLMGDETATEAAKKSGISSSNFTRWKKGAKADPDFVVKIARAYNANVLDALVAAEFITAEEAKSGIGTDNRLGESMRAMETSAAIADVSAGFLQDALRQIQAAYIRDRLGETVPAHELKNSELIRKKFQEALNVTTEQTKDELAALRSNVSEVDVRGLPYAANRRKPEPEEGDDDYGSGA